MSKLFKAKKVLLGIATTATIIMTSWGSYTQVYAYAPGCSKEEIEVPKEETVAPPPAAPEAATQEEAVTLPSVVPEAPKQEETVTPPTVAPEAPKQEVVEDAVFSVKTPFGEGTATVEGHYGTDEEIQKMYELINEYRIANGKEPLTYNIKMNTVNRGADERAVTTANYWEHWHYAYSENIAYTPVFYSGYDDMEMVEKVFQAWIELPGHRNNILNAGSTKNETAISVFYKKVEGGYERYWVQCFR